MVSDSTDDQHLCREECVIEKSEISQDRLGCSAETELVVFLNVLLLFLFSFLLLLWRQCHNHFLN